MHACTRSHNIKNVLISSHELFTIRKYFGKLIWEIEQLIERFFDVMIKICPVCDETSINVIVQETRIKLFFIFSFRVEFKWAHGSLTLSSALNIITI